MLKSPHDSVCRQHDKPVLLHIGKKHHYIFAVFVGLALLPQIIAIVESRLIAVVTVGNVKLFVLKAIFDGRNKLGVGDDPKTMAKTVAVGCRHVGGALFLHFAKRKDFSPVDIKGINLAEIAVCGLHEVKPVLLGL